MDVSKDIAFLRRIADRAPDALGEDGVLLASHLNRYLSDVLQEQRLQRRDEALVNLAYWFQPSPLSKDFPMKIHASAGTIDFELRKYERGDWKSTDRALNSKGKGLPPEHDGTQRAMMFAVLIECEDASPPGESRIYKILSSHYEYCAKVGNERAVLTDDTNHHHAIRSTRSKALPMNSSISKSDRKLLEGLQKSPLGQKIAADEAAELIAKRQGLIDARANLEARAEIEFPKFRKAMEKKVEGVREVEKLLKKANDELAQAGYAISSASYAKDREAQRIEMMLRETADNEALDAFRSEMLDELEAARQRFEYREIYHTNPVTGRTTRRCYNNRPSWDARMSAIDAAFKEIETLRFSADQSLVRGRLDAIRAALPKIEPAILPTFEA